MWILVVMFTVIGISAFVIFQVIPNRRALKGLRLIDASSIPAIQKMELLLLWRSPYASARQFKELKNIIAEAENSMRMRRLKEEKGKSSGKV